MLIMGVCLGPLICSSLLTFAITPFTFHSHDYSLLIFIPLEGSIPEIINSNNLTITFALPIMGHKESDTAKQLHFHFPFTFTFCSPILLTYCHCALYFDSISVFSLIYFLSVYPDFLIPLLFSYSVGFYKPSLIKFLLYPQ